jgi:hypothetical protein
MVPFPAPELAIAPIPEHLQSFAEFSSNPPKPIVTGFFDQFREKRVVTGTWPLTHCSFIEISVNTGRLYPKNAHLQVSLPLPSFFRLILLHDLVALHRTTNAVAPSARVERPLSLPSPLRSPDRPIRLSLRRSNPALTNGVRVLLAGLWRESGRFPDPIGGFSRPPWEARAWVWLLGNGFWWTGTGWFWVLEADWLVLVIGGGKAGDWAWFWGNGGWLGRENGAWLEGKWGLVGGEMGPSWRGNGAYAPGQSRMVGARGAGAGGGRW